MVEIASQHSQLGEFFSMTSSCQKEPVSFLGAYLFPVGFFSMEFFLRSSFFSEKMETLVAMAPWKKITQLHSCYLWFNPEFLYTRSEERREGKIQGSLDSINALGQEVFSIHQIPNIITQIRQISRQFKIACALGGSYIQSLKE